MGVWESRTYPHRPDTVVREGKDDCNDYGTATSTPLDPSSLEGEDALEADLVQVAPVSQGLEVGY